MRQLSGERMERWSERIAALDPATLALRLTLLDLLLRPIGTGLVRPAVLVLAAAGLGIPALLGSGAFWLALAVTAGVRVVSDWPVGDNHAYLLGYWCVAVALGCRVGARDAVCAASARWMIGLVFAFAVMWKALSPDYLDGRFFRVMLVVDHRFEAFTQLAGGLDAAELEAQRSFLVQHVDDALGAVLPGPPEPARLRAVAIAVTHTAFAAEIAVALAFLAPAGRGPSRWRDPLLIAFAACTYAVAPVEGFGWLLLAMGLAQCDRARPWLRAAYPAVFALLVVYRELPWGRWLLELAR
jgi:hypothetical protein